MELVEPTRVTNAINESARMIVPPQEAGNPLRLQTENYSCYHITGPGHNQFFSWFGVNICTNTIVTDCEVLRIK